MLLAELHRVYEAAGSHILSIRRVSLNTPASKMPAAKTYISPETLKGNTINIVIWLQKPTQGKLESSQPRCICIKRTGFTSALAMLLLSLETSSSLFVVPINVSVNIN